MRNFLLSSLACALVLCVSVANADVYEYNDLTGTLETETWKISDLYGTGYADGGKDEKGNYGPDGWTVTNAPEPWTLLYDNFMPSQYDRFIFESTTLGEYLIELAFSFEASSDADLEKTIKFSFENLSSAGVISFFLNGIDLENKLKSEYNDNASKGYFYISLADLLTGEAANTLYFSVNNTGFVNENSESTVVGYRITGAEGDSTTPEPATLAIIGLGTLGAGFAARRRITKK